MLKASRTAARIATGSANTTAINLTEKACTNNFYNVQTPWDEIAINDKMPFLQKLNDQIFAKDKRVTKVMASLGDTTSHILFCNSEGQIYYDYRPIDVYKRQIKYGHFHKRYYLFNYNPFHFGL